MEGGMIPTTFALLVGPLVLIIVGLLVRRRDRPKKGDFWRLFGEGEKNLRRLSVANVNLGGRFSNVFEFISSDEEWRRRYEAMIGIFDEDFGDGRTWREVYESLNLEQDLAVQSRPSALRGHPTYWYHGDYVAEWERKVGVKSDLKYLDFMCELALSRAFQDRDDFDRFERRFPHVTRSSEAWQAKLRLIFQHLAGSDVIAVEEAISSSVDIDLTTFLDIASSFGKGTYSCVIKRDAEMAVLWRSTEAVIIDLQDDHNLFNVKDRSQSTLHVPHRDPFDDDDPDEELPGVTFSSEEEEEEDVDVERKSESPRRQIRRRHKRRKETRSRDGAETRKAVRAMETTRKKTIALDLGDVVVIGVHAREHKGCAKWLARYFKDLTGACGERKPVIILSDTNVERAADDVDFQHALDEYRLAEPKPVLPTTFKERTIFQAQKAKASFPPAPRPFLDAPDTIAGLYEADRRTEPNSVESRFVRAPKDRIIFDPENATLISRAIVPDAFRDPHVRLPTPAWPSDHVACTANFFILPIPTSSSR